MDRVVVLGASGYLGAHIAHRLAALGHEVVAVSRSAALPVPGCKVARCDATDGPALRRVAGGAALVVNAIHAPPAASAVIARSLGDLLREDRVGRIVHLSSLAVFGQQAGVLHERSRPQPAWGHAYAAAKLHVETILAADEALRGRCAVLRLGCVYGPQAPVWVDRLLRLIRAGRLGWLGGRGQGACPLIHVADVAHAVGRVVATGASGTHHLLSPGRLSWNAYFQLLADHAGIAPLRPQGALSLAREVWLTAPLHAGLDRLSPAPRDRITPAMARLFRSRATLTSMRAPILPPDAFVPLELGIAEAVAAFDGASVRTAPSMPRPAQSARALAA